MKIPRYWARAVHTMPNYEGDPVSATGFGWSHTSQAEAETMAQARAHTLALRLTQDVSNFGTQKHYYGERPLREEIIETLPGLDDDTPSAMITRNAYGALVLNAAEVLFVDIDFPEAPRPRTSLRESFLGHLLGHAPAPAPTPPASAHESAALERLTHWVAAHPDWGLRVYRTAAGLRGLATHTTFDPTVSSALLEALDCDPLYVRLTRAQQSFRARLTPKPWRCGIRQGPPARFPWANADAEARYRTWQRTYEAQAANYATCRLLAHLGRTTVDPRVAPVLTTHDSLACTSADLPLA